MSRAAILYLPTGGIMLFKEGEAFNYGEFNGIVASILVNYHEGTLRINYVTKDKDGHNTARIFTAVGMRFSYDKEKGQ